MNVQEKRKPAPRIDVACFMAGLNHATGNAVGYHSYVTEVLSILCSRNPLDAQVIFSHAA